MLISVLEPWERQAEIGPKSVLLKKVRHIPKDVEFIFYYLICFQLKYENPLPSNSEH